MFLVTSWFIDFLNHEYTEVKEGFYIIEGRILFALVTSWFIDFLNHEYTEVKEGFYIIEGRILFALVTSWFIRTILYALVTSWFIRKMLYVPRELVVIVYSIFSILTIKSKK